MQKTGQGVQKMVKQGPATVEENLIRAAGNNPSMGSLQLK